ncbi:MAG: hypothetical protein JOZ77_02295 [Candidatus Eremiobacteraeota bacterium]|nr:hypothetical protein [Candidatus Eremiobacteraeota bacterium]
MRAIAGFAIGALLAACGGGPYAGYAAYGGSAHADAAAGKVYQPLAMGNLWKFTCNHLFPITDRVVGTYHVKTHLVYALSLQIPSSPTKSTYVIQLLANDSKGNTWIYGYLIHGKVHAVTPTEIVAAKPVPYRYYDYPAPMHGTITRQFLQFEDTNRTPLGVFWVAPYFDSDRTHNYGYSLGRGVMEEDHGPQYKYDCLIEKYVLH